MWWLPLNRSLGSWSAFNRRRRAQVSASMKPLASELDQLLEQNIDRMQAELADDLAASMLSVLNAGRSAE